MILFRIDNKIHLLLQRIPEVSLLLKPTPIFTTNNNYNCNPIDNNCTPHKVISSLISPIIINLPRSINHHFLIKIINQLPKILNLSKNRNLNQSQLNNNTHYSCRKV